MGSDERSALAELHRGRFQLLERVGAGGMGEVWRGRDALGDAPVAIKLLHEEEPAFAERLLREAELLARLVHPGIVRFVARGRDERHGVYLVMAWLEGEDLGARLARGPLELGESVQLARRLCEALQVAHGHGVIHRDLKPSNIFLVEGDATRPVLIDFGIARTMSRTQALTEPGAMLGTVGYMSPEQVQGRAAIDGRADLFSLGCVLFECLTGRPAFDGEHPVAILTQILFEEAPRLSEHLAHAPPALSALLSALVRRAPAQRPADAASVLAALDGLDAVDAVDAVDAAQRLPAASSVESAALSSDEQVHVCVLLLRHAVPSEDALAATLAELEGAQPGSLAGDLEPLVVHFGGRSLELGGDTSLAVFEQQSQAGEETAEAAVRAARCALALRERSPALDVAMATGLAHGTARGLVGAAVDRAAGLAAAAGERDTHDVLVDAVSARFVESRFELVPSGGAWRLVRERPVGAARRVRGRATRCVGRRRELAMLVASCEEAFEASIAQLVLLIGAAGIGKSRLVRELRRQEVARGVRWLELDCDPVAAGSTFGVLAQCLQRGLGRSTAELAAGGLREGLADAIAGEERLGYAAEILGELLRLEPERPESPLLLACRRDPALMGQHVRQAFGVWFEGYAAKSPLVIAIDDVHWADALSLEALGALAHGERAAGLLVVATARPTLEARFPALWRERDVHRLEVGPIKPHSARELVRELAQTALERDAGGALEAQLERLVAQAAGNAFFLEELVRHVTEAAASGGGELPQTVLAMAAARLRRLDGVLRRVLRAASIFGERFRPRELAALLGGGAMGGERGATGVGVTAAIESLVQQEVLEVVSAPGGGVDEAREYRFRHGLLREAAYAMLTPGDRALGHRLAAEYLATCGVDPRLIGEHHLAGDEPRRAAEWLLAAGKLAFRAGDLVETRRLSELGLGCEPPRALEGRLRLLLVEALAWGEELSVCVEASSRAVALLPEASSDWLMVASCMTYAAVYGHQESWLEAVLQLVARVPQVLEAEAVNGLSVFRLVGALLNIGHAPRALELAQRLARAVATARGHDAEVLAGWCALSMGYLAIMRVAHEVDVDAELERARQHFEAAQDVLGELVVRYVRLVACFDAGSHERVVELADAVMRDSSALRATTVATSAQAFRGLSLLQLGREEAAAADHAAVQRTQNWLFSSSGDVAWALHAVRSGDFAAVTRLRELYDATPRVAATRGLAALALGSIALAVGDVAGAREYGAAAAGSVAACGGLSSTRRALDRLKSRLGESEW